MNDPTIQPQPAQVTAPAMPAVIDDPTTQGVDIDPVQAQLGELSARLDDLVKRFGALDAAVDREFESQHERLKALEQTRLAARQAAIEPAPQAIDPQVVQADVIADEPAQPQAEPEVPATQTDDGSLPVGTKLKW